MPNDTESPDHAGLRADARMVVSRILLNSHSQDVQQDIVAQFGITCWSAGRDSQSAELATLRADNAEFQKEVNALAGQVQELRRALTDERDTGRDAEDYQWRPDPTDRASYATGEALAEEEG